MLCEACGQNAATVHVTNIVNSKKRETHLCDGCYKLKENIALKTQEVSIAEALGGLVSLKGDYEDIPGDCPNCGMSYEEFRSQARLGCARDYEHFKPKLIALLEKLHEKSKHVGKVPRHRGERLQRRKQVDTLKSELQKAVELEEYERAAEIRDQIKALEAGAEA